MKQPAKYQRLTTEQEQAALKPDDNSTKADMQSIVKRRVRARAGQDIRHGRLKRQPCEICGDEPAECHHIDYADPGRVMWLCTLHHKQTHSQFGKPAPVDWMADIRAAQRKIDTQRIELQRQQPSGPASGN